MKACNSSPRQDPFLLTFGVALLLAVSAHGQADHADEAPQSDAGEAENWRLVQAYLDLDRAWHARDWEIHRSDVPLEEKERMREEERGEHPDIVLAVVAARKLAAGEGMRARDAARFLIEETSGQSPTEVGDREFGQAALVRLVERDWAVIEAYNEAYEAWYARAIDRSGVPLEPKERMREEERVEHPDIVLAVAVARKLVAGDGMRARDAARFLVQRSDRRSPTGAGDREFGRAALVRLVGPDWSAIEAYNEAYAAWQEEEAKRREESRSDASAGEPFLYKLPPKPLEAVAAVQAILEAGPSHEHANEAVEFLLALPAWQPEAVLSGARVLADNFPEFDKWPKVLAELDRKRLGHAAEAIAEFLREMAAKANDPVVRAIARYYAAKGLAESLNDPSMDAEDRDSRRQQALALATGLSLGVETETFVSMRSFDGEKESRTLAEVEALLVHGIRHATVGATVADESGWRMDGARESLSAYAGQVILVDFWATWCGPCVAAIPRKRELAERYSGEPFTILAISVDDEAQTVIDFMEDEPMPWAHWHIGGGSDLETSWRIAGFPTYVVIGRDGVILSRDNALDGVVNAIERAFDGGA